VEDVSRTLSESQAFDALLGLEIIEITPELASGRVVVRDEILQPFGVVHGGVYASVAESLASRGTLAGVWSEGSFALGLSNHTSFLRPVSAGTITATARPLHRGRTTWVWDVEMTDEAGKRCAVSRVTIAVRPLADAQPR
jgi:1,4-dihydroxy-2-naphthoyl-CoA hydrolase